jgi:hypothetical protein
MIYVVKQRPKRIEWGRTNNIATEREVPIDIGQSTKEQGIAVTGSRIRK